MLKACLIAPAVALLLVGAAVAQPMPLPPSVSDAPAAAARPGTKAKSTNVRTRASDASQSGTSVARPRQSTAAPLKPFDRRDIADPESDRSRLQPQLTPGGGIGMGGRF